MKQGTKMTEESRKKLSLSLKRWFKTMRPWNTGKKLTEEHKKKMSDALRGRKHSDEFRKEMSKIALRDGRGKYNKGKKQSEEWKRNKVAGNLGKNHWNWKGGITPENTKLRFSEEGKAWVKACMTRDGYTCQKCGAHNGLGKTIYLQVHHLVNFSDVPELRFVVSNGITLCRRCHKEFHSIYGIKHNSEVQLREFLTTQS